MQGDYPHFKTTYVQEELVEHFLLNPTERALVDTCYGDVVWSKNSCGFARVVFQEPSEPFMTLHRTLRRRV